MLELHPELGAACLDTWETVSVAAGVIGVELPTAVRTLFEMASKVGRSTGFEIAQDSPLGRGQAGSKAGSKGSLVEANKIRHLQHLSSRAGSESLHELIQWHPHGGSDRLGQMGVDLGGPRTPVAQSLLNDPEVDAGFQQMSGVGMAQRVHVGSFGDPALLEGAVEGRLQGTSADGTLPSLPGREQPLGAAKSCTPSWRRSSRPGR